MPKLPTKSGSETLEVRLEVEVEVEVEVGLEARREVEVEVGLEVGLEVEVEVGLVEFWLLPLFGIVPPRVLSPIAPKKLT
nr:hypothetical protein [Microcystis sp. LEGE 08355]